MLGYGALVLTVLSSVAVLTHGQSARRRQTSQEVEEAIIHRLLSRYDPNTRPGLDNAPVTVNISLSVRSLTEMDVEKGALDLTAYLTLFWTDSRLQYNSEGISSLRIDRERVWTPDIELYNSVAPGMTTLNWNRNRVIVSPDGSVLNIPMVGLRSSCSAGPRGDRAVCKLKFGSWTHSGNEVDVGLYGGIELENAENRLWQVVSTSAEREVKHYDCCPEPYPYVVFTLELRRRPERWYEGITNLWN